MAAKLKIIYVADRINSPDGSAVHARAFVNAVQKIGHDIITCPAMTPINYSKPKKIPDSEKNFRYYLGRINFNLIKSYIHRSNPYVSEYFSLCEGLYESVRQHRRLMQLLSRFKADVMIFRNHLFKFGPFWTSKATGTPLVLEVNSLQSMENKLRRKQAAATWPTRWAERYALTSADAIFTVSQPILDRIRNVAGDKPSRVVENGVDCDFFDPQRYPKQEAKRNLGLENKTVIGYVGSYMPWHDLATTIDTLSILRNVDSNYHLLLIGAGVDYEKIKSKVTEKRLTDAVTFISSVPHEKMPQYLAAFDIALMTYPKIQNFYFSPLKMFEYLSMGLTVIATNVGQVGEIITDDLNGILVDIPSPSKFANAIKAAKSAQNNRGIEARKLVKSNHSWLKNSEKIVELSKTVLRSNNSGKK